MLRWSIVIVVQTVFLQLVFFPKTLPASKFDMPANLKNVGTHIPINPKVLSATVPYASNRQYATIPEVIQNTKKLLVPFIANKGQTDERVAFYANIFWGSVFVTKDGEIVYSLTGSESGESKAERLKSEVNGRHREQESRSQKTEHRRGTIKSLPVHSAKLDQNVLAQTASLKQSEKASRILVPTEDISINPQYEICNRSAERSRRSPKSGARGIVLKEEFVGGKVNEMKGEAPSATKVSYFTGNDSKKWQYNIPTYDVVMFGEVYKGMELKLKSYGNNVERLFTVRLGADPDQIKIMLSGANLQEFPLNKGGDRGVLVNEHGELEVETELGIVKFTKPVAYQEIDGKRVEVECKYMIADCGMQNNTPLTPIERGMCESPLLRGDSRLGKAKFRNQKFTNPKSAIVRLSAHDEVRNPNSECPLSEVLNLQSETRNPFTVLKSPPTTKPGNSSLTPCLYLHF